MLKKGIVMLMLLVALMSRAQYTAGEWVLHPSFAGANVQNCMDVGDKIYYLASGSLFCLDKDTQENESLNKSNYLSDFTIDGIYYNYIKHYLVIAYDNSNIDILQDNGKVINLPEIKDAIINSEKSITNVSFGDGNRMYVATKFGYVVYDDSKFIVKESHIYNTTVNSLFEYGNNLVAVIDNRALVAPVTGEHDTKNSFHPITLTGSAKQYYTYMKMTRIADRVFVDAQWIDTIATTTTNQQGQEVTTYSYKNYSYCYTSSFSGTGTEATMKFVALVGAMADNVLPSANGFIANFKAYGFYYTFDSNGASPKKVTATKELYTSAPGGNGTLWALGLNGLHQSGDEANYYHPNGISIAGNPFWLAFSPGQNKVYVQTSGDNFLFSATEAWQPFEVCTFDGQTWRNETPSGVPTGQGGSAYNISFDPNDNNTYFYGSRTQGLVKISNGTLQYIFTGSPGGKYRAVQTFDSQGNLWCAYPYALLSSNSYPLIMLPKAKVSASSITASDWKRFDVPEIVDGGLKRATIAVGKDDIITYSNGGYYEAILFIDPRGVADQAKPKVHSYTSFLDQDDKMVSWTYMRTMTADLTGKIWLAIDGVVSLDPTQAFNDNFRVNHIKVPRNDGTGLADYLLEGISVNTIAVDANNYKWIGTNGSGLYQVSEDGSQIINQFTTSNSFLPSDVIYNVVCNTNNNSVYILTANGFVEYRSFSGGGSSQLSEVHCYPNPVTPDFTGLLTITGVGSNAIVKVADSAGNVIKTLKSAGGIATWDCCDANGDRVNTGVYFVLASTDGNSSNNSIVAKFLVVK